MNIKRIPAINSIEQLLSILSSVNAAEEYLFFEEFKLGLWGYRFEHNEQTFVIDSVLFEENEIPLVSVFREDVFNLINNGYDCLEIEEKSSTERGYYTNGEYGDFLSEYSNHTEWCFYAGGRYSWNLPNIKNGTLIGYYWVDLLGVLEKLTPVRSC